MRVLIAHDDVQTRERVATTLEPLGHAVRACADAAEALAACSEWAPDVTLLDAELCRREDMRLLSAIKSDTDAYRTAVIMLFDGGPELDEAIEELRRGAHDFLVEPLNEGELVARVEAAGRTKSLQEELLGQAQRLEQLIFEDPLTGVFNRRAVLMQLEALVSGARRHGRDVSVVMIDIDHFKSFNDRHGHPVGDRVLVAVGHALRDRLRTEDHIGRLGGEEFLVLLPDTGAEEAARVAEDLRGCVESVAPDGLSVTASVGWATWTGEEPETLIKRADAALYEAKNAGRNLVRGA